MPTISRVSDSNIFLSVSDPFLVMMFSCDDVSTQQHIKGIVHPKMISSLLTLILFQTSLTLFFFFFFLWNTKSYFGKCVYSQSMGSHIVWLPTFFKICFFVLQKKQSVNMSINTLFIIYTPSHFAVLHCTVMLVFTLLRTDILSLPPFFSPI